MKKKKDCSVAWYISHVSTSPKKLLAVRECYGNICRNRSLDLLTFAGLKRGANLLAPDLEQIGSMLSRVTISRLKCDCFNTLIHPSLAFGILTKLCWWFQCPPFEPPSHSDLLSHPVFRRHSFNVSKWQFITRLTWLNNVKRVDLSESTKSTAPIQIFLLN